MRIAAVLCIFAAAAAANQNFEFRVDAPAEIVADLTLSSPGADWASEGREAAVARVVADNHPEQYVTVYAGPEQHTYSVFLGKFDAGRHKLRIERDTQLSAKGAGLEIGKVEFRTATPGEPNFAVFAHAPVLFARQDTIGRFTDIPLLMYCERLNENGRPYLQYTIIFSNEDGGTSTRALMARWGRTTDIEYVYKAFLNDDGTLIRGTIQAKDHEEIEFRGKFFGTHPLLTVSTINNMVSDAEPTNVRYQLVPVDADLSNRTRESVMDEHPITWSVMAKELIREQKLRPYGTVEGQKISDPRNYLYVDVKAAFQSARLKLIARRQGDHWMATSDLGQLEYAVGRDGWFRTTLELPPGTIPETIEEIGVECLVAPVPPGKPLPEGGLCKVDQIAAFMLDEEYRPRPVLMESKPAIEIRTGSILLLR
ncbi:MAG TPA: hypothetical protein VFQ79_14480 [Bryobacteraceae bacterium]|nr:hypothetical protein [Bryobacteraceae bacterium]